MLGLQRQFPGVDLQTHVFLGGIDVRFRDQDQPHGGRFPGPAVVLDRQRDLDRLTSRLRHAILRQDGKPFLVVLADDLLSACGNDPRTLLATLRGDRGGGSAITRSRFMSRPGPQRLRGRPADPSGRF